MPQVKVTKLFDDTAGHGKSVTSYNPTGGKERDGVYDVSDAVAARMAAAGVIDAPKAKSTGGEGGTGGTGGGTGGGTNK